MIEQYSSKLATIPEVDADERGSIAVRLGRIRPMDRSDLELHRDILLGHLLDGFFGGQHLLGVGRPPLGLRLLGTELLRHGLLLFVWLLLLAVRFRLDDFNVSNATHKHPFGRRALQVQEFDSSRDSDHFPLEVLVPLDAELLELVSVNSRLFTDQCSSKVATILEVEVSGAVVS